MNFEIHLSFFSSFSDTLLASLALTASATAEALIDTILIREIHCLLQTCECGRAQQMTGSPKH